MTVKVYGADDALWTVRLQSGFSVEGIKFGYSEPKSRTTTAATTVAVQPNAQPSPPRRQTSITAAACATTAMPSTNHVQSLPCASWVHNPKPATTTVTGGARP